MSHTTPTPHGGEGSLPHFRPAGTPVRADKSNAAHSHAEAVIVAAAQHILPQRPAPDHKEPGPQIDTTAAALKLSQDQGKCPAEEQEPLMAGTLLDEMQSPGLSSPGPPTTEQGDDLFTSMTNGSRKRPPRQMSSDTLRPSRPIQPMVKVDEEGAGDQGTTPMDSSKSSPGPQGVGDGRASRPGYGATRGIGSVRMGASALISALNAMPWEGDEDGDSSDDDAQFLERGQGDRLPAGHANRPGVSRIRSSLHTIRPMSASVHGDEPHTIQSHPHPSHSLQIPFHQNTMARRAQPSRLPEATIQSTQQPSTNDAPGDQGEQAADGGIPYPRGFESGNRKLSDASTSSSLSLAPAIQESVDDQISREEEAGRQEEALEILRAAEEDDSLMVSEQAKLAMRDSKLSHELNTKAALRGDHVGEKGEVDSHPPLSLNAADKKRSRREALAEKLQEVFGLGEREEVLEEMRCWLLRSVMLKGYMYLTMRHICFFALMPNRENLIVKTGPLYKKASRTKRNNKYWVILKNDVLSWFESTADPYFPKGNVSLQYASSCDAVDDARFKLRTTERNYTFTAETETARDEWIKAIKKVMFKTQHEGESVKLIIPLEAVLDIDKSPTLEFAETIEIKCVDPEDQMSVDSYFFASFQDNERAYEAIQHRLDQRPSSELPRVSSQLSLQATEAENTEAARKAQEAESSHLGLKKIGSVLRPLLSRSSDKDNDSDSLKTTESISSGFSIPFMSKSHKSSVGHDTLDTEQTEPLRGLSPQDEKLDGYPPKPSGPPPAGMVEDGKGWAPTWIRKPTKMFGGSSSKGSSSRRVSGADRGLTDTPTQSVAKTGRAEQTSVTEVVESMMPITGDESEDESTRLAAGHHRSTRLDSDSSQQEAGYSMMEPSESGQQEDDETANKFRSVFSLPEKEELIDHFPGYLYRVLPVSGRFFVSTNFFCFRSAQLLYKTKMIIPISDLYGLKAQKAFRLKHAGLIIVIKGHEELFLEFSTSKRRKACVALLEQRMEEVRLRSEKGEETVDNTKIKARIMEDLNDSTPVEPIAASMADVDATAMFGSATSTFLEFKPEPMKITCLTIGSRGDVQPYIALCKGLQAEGHHTRIASHGEYKDWVEGHDIEFASVGGDPAELMQMCVDNGMFTYAFMKEGLQKFRGWLDDLLTSSWEACQGSDLLIESPSAMGGIHIAEALRIPYYRAFTMPWTRTRAYPHAFAVPEYRRGGSYNYMTFTMFDQVFWRAISGQVNRWRRRVLGIDSTKFDKLEQHKVPFLYNFSPSIVPPPLDWTEWIHVTGYWFLSNADESSAKKDEEKWSPPQDLLDFMDKAHQDGKKIVYIGFGSIVVADPQEMTRVIVEAVTESGVCAILSKGWSDRGSKAKGEDKADEDGADGIKFPPEIFSIDSIDHSWLFPRIDAAVHHGGAGTSGASLRAGIPTIIKPFFGDQAFWSERVESLNVGSAVRKLTTEDLAEALKKATTDEKQIAKAKVVGEIIRKENGVANAIQAIYRDLEYAKSIIKPLPDEKTLLKTTTTHSLLPVSTSNLANLVRPRTRTRTGSSSSSSSQQAEKSGSRSWSRSRRKDRAASDESWSVVSDSEREKDKSGSTSRTGSRSRSGSSVPDWVRGSERDMSGSHQSGRSNVPDWVDAAEGRTGSGSGPDLASPLPV